MMVTDFRGTVDPDPAPRAHESSTDYDSSTDDDEIEEESILPSKEPISDCGFDNQSSFERPKMLHTGELGGHCTIGLTP